jgi:aspartate racemase
MLLQSADWLIASEHAEAIVVACSEISLAVRPGDLTVPVIDTMDVLADAILDLASGQRPLASLGLVTK